MNTHDNKHNDSHCKTTDKKTLVVIGGGFAGLNLVKRLNKRQWDVVVIDRFNFHSFPPLFYQVASAGLDPGSISFPLRREMRQRRLRVQVCPDCVTKQIVHRHVMSDFCK